MVNKPLIRPYFWWGVALGGVARIPMILYGNVMGVDRPDRTKKAKKFSQEAVVFQQEMALGCVSQSPINGKFCVQTLRIHNELNHKRPIWVFPKIMVPPNHPF